MRTMRSSRFTDQCLTEWSYGTAPETPRNRHALSTQATIRQDGGDGRAKGPLFK
jgi:hypothetical protein